MKKRHVSLLICATIFVLIVLSGCQQHRHTFGEWVVTNNATCTATGEKVRTCECGYNQTQSIKATGHSFSDWTITTAATCTTDGSQFRTCTCGEKETVAIGASGHIFGDWTTISAATCQNSGEQSHTCTTCNTTQKEIISKTGHQYDGGKVTTAATCQNAGVKTYTCVTCKTTKTETIAKTGHQYNGGKVTTAATCQNAGVKTYTCATCKTTKTETIAKLGHNPNSSNICTRCGIECPISLNMTASEIEAAKKVAWIAERDIDALDDKQQFRLMFSLKDSAENWLKVPVVVNIKITNNSGELVYKATKIVKASDYSGWSNNYGKKWTAAAIYIPYTDITPGTSEKGTVSFEVYNDYVSFNTSTLNISSGLPMKATTISLPTMPQIIHDYTYSGRIDSSVKITNITYKISNDDLYIYFTGEKIYDQEGNGYSQSCKVGWKLYDQDGYIVDSGTFYSPAVAVGEKFRDEKEYAWDVIKPGKTYTLKISNVD